MRVVRLRAAGGPEQLTVERADRPRPGPARPRLVDGGDLRPPPVEVFPFASAREAFARSLESGRRGKVVLTVAA